VLFLQVPVQVVVSRKGFDAHWVRTGERWTTSMERSHVPIKVFSQSKSFVTGQLLASESTLVSLVMLAAIRLVYIGSTELLK
jgi:hypothetical protein